MGGSHIALLAEWLQPAGEAARVGWGKDFPCSAKEGDAPVVATVHPVTFSKDGDDVDILKVTWSVSGLPDPEEQCQLE